MVEIDEGKLLKAAESSRPIGEFINLSNRKYLPGLDVPGLYVFWFNNHDGVAFSLKRDVIIHGPNGKPEDLCWDWHLDHKKICLYVGKSTNIQNRLGLHLMLKTPNLYDGHPTRLRKKTTSCQLRSGFDFLYPGVPMDVLLKRLGERVEFSFIPEEDFARRFYMEDLMVGKLLPWFNVDFER